MSLILRRSLTASTIFRRAWCTATAADPHDPPFVPGGDVLPRSVRGILNNYCDYSPPHLFARPSGGGGARISMPYAGSVYDHCNGLVLCYNDYGAEFCVVNPATRRRADLPPYDHSTWRCAGAYLAFDPSISLHYKAFLVPDVDPISDAEWPPAVYKLPVFSSRSGWFWGEKAFVREGGPVGTAADVRLDSVEPVFWGPQRRYAEYWRGALYVHCRGAYVMRYVVIYIYIYIIYYIKSRPKWGCTMSPPVL